MLHQAIIENAELYEKWGYDTKNGCFVFFTLHDEWEGEDCFYCRFKAKVWINGTFKEFTIQEKRRAQIA